MELLLLGNVIQALNICLFLQGEGSSGQPMAHCRVRHSCCPRGWGSLQPPNTETQLNPEQCFTHAAPLPCLAAVKGEMKLGFYPLPPCPHQCSLLHQPQHQSAPQRDLLWSPSQPETSFLRYHPRHDCYLSDLKLGHFGPEAYHYDTVDQVAGQGQAVEGESMVTRTGRCRHHLHLNKAAGSVLWQEHGPACLPCGSETFLSPPKHPLGYRAAAKSGQRIDSA